FRRISHAKTILERRHHVLDKSNSVRLARLLPRNNHAPPTRPPTTRLRCARAHAPDVTPTHTRAAPPSWAMAPAAPTTRKGGRLEFCDARFGLKRRPRWRYFRCYLPPTPSGWRPRVDDRQRDQAVIPDPAPN